MLGDGAEEDVRNTANLGREPSLGPRRRVEDKVEGLMSRAIGGFEGAGGVHKC